MGFSNNSSIQNRLSETFQGDTQDVTARKLSTTQGNVSKWIQGRQIPTSEMLRDISKAYKVSVDWILGISDQKEIDGVALEKLTYEQIARIIDRLMELGTIAIPDLQKLKDENLNNEKYIEIDDEEKSPSKPPILDTDYIKIRDRFLSFILRRRWKLYEIGDDYADNWKSQSLPIYRDVQLLSYTGNMEKAIDTRNWATFKNDSDWVDLVRKLSSMTEEERSALIEKSKKKEKDGEKDG